MSFRHAWAFLTRLPGGAHPDDERALGLSVPWFPVAGALIGLLIGLVWLGLNELVSPLTSATIAVMVGVMITGAFHEDGLADTADSLGGYTPERRLEIMKDSRVGTFGVLALVFSVLIRVVGLAALEPVEGLVALVMAHAVGRSIATLVMVTTPAASATGLGQSYTAYLPKPAVWAIGAVIAGCSIVGGPGGVVGYLVALLGAVLLVVLARRAYGGTTGDVLGAVEQVGEMAVLSAAARLVAEHGWNWG
ncbi:MAG: adenosylcobinamide-GDP ribazoletransferase [Actinomycetota bacterium]